MAAVDPNLLRSSLEQTLSPFTEVRQGAEQFLASVSAQPGFVVVVLQVLESAQEEIAVRLAAALLFKNFIKRNWDPEKEGCIAADEKQVVKDHLVELMCRVPEAIQKQLIEALATISEYEFPHNWQTLLAQLVKKLVEGDWQVRNGVLMTANTIFKRFRNVFKSDSLYAELKHCLDEFQEPLLVMYRETGVALRAPGASVADQLQMLAALRTMSRIFFSLNWQDLPEYFEDHISEWMTEFLTYFNYSNPALGDSSNEDEPDPIDLLLVAIVESINLYADKYDDEFKPYLSKFTEEIWNLLANRITLQPKHDDLAAKSMRFLTHISSRSIHRSVFESDQVLTGLCGIVVNNMQLRSSDEELFEDNPMDYIRRDVEGADGDSRRGAARDLVRGLLNSFSAEVSQICRGTIQTQMQQYQANPASNWALKDVSINLVIAISALKQSRLRGVSEVNPHFPMMEFFMSEVLPELSNQAQASPILRADAIKFVSTFRNQMTIDAMEQLFPLLVNCLDPTQFVVHSYAAVCIERLLTVKDNGVVRFSKSRLAPYLEKLLDHLFNIMEQPNYPENDYLVRLVMRLLHVAKEDVLPLADRVVDRLTQTLNKICANPSNPTFSHFLFESLSVLILNVCSTNPAATERFETLLFPPFQKILANDVDALCPYVYQVLAQMLELRPSGISPAYISMFPVLLTPALWDRVSNAPAIVKLLEAYMRKAPTEVSQSAQGLLGVFQKLISSRATEAHGFSILRAFFAFMPKEAYEGFLNEIVKILMIRLQSRMAGRNATTYVVDLIYTMSILMAKLGPDVFVRAMETLQPGMSTMFLKSVWAENAPKVRGRNEKKATVVGTTRLLCESETCTSNFELWEELLLGALAVVAELDGQGAVKDEVDALEDLEQTGYEAGFSRLHFASVVPTDCLAEYPVSREYFATSLSTLAAARPGVYSSYVQQKLQAPALQALQGLLAQYNLSFQ